MDDSRHVSVWIERPADEVYPFASDVTRLPQWAAGLATTLRSGEAVYNPMRVIPAATPAEPRCEMAFTVRRRDLTDEEFESDIAAVAADLERLRQLLEG